MLGHGRSPQELAQLLKRLLKVSGLQYNDADISSFAQEQFAKADEDVQRLAQRWSRDFEPGRGPKISKITTQTFQLINY